MRIVLIDYNATPVIDSAYMGYTGEHNETEVRISPPDEMLENQLVATFCAAIKVNGNVYHSAAATRSSVATAGYYSVKLTSELTQAEQLEIQLEAYGSSSNLVAKSDTVNGYLTKSIDGADVELTGDAGIVADVEANTAFRESVDTAALAKIAAGTGNRLKFNNVEYAKKSEVTSLSISTVTYPLDFEEAGAASIFGGETSLAIYSDVITSGALKNALIVKIEISEDGETYTDAKIVAAQEASAFEILTVPYLLNDSGSSMSVVGISGDVVTSITNAVSMKIYYIKL